MHIQSNGVRLHVVERGQGALALVLLHYWGGSQRTWSRVVDTLAPAYRTIAIDQRGWGCSEAPAGGYALADLADDAQGVIAALNLRDYVLVGHSMGGKVAQLLASRRPAGLRALVLVAPSPPAPFALPLEARRGMVDAYASVDAIEATLAQMLVAAPLAEADRQQVIEDSLAGAPQAKAAWPLAMMIEDISEQVAAIQVPTLVVAGELDRVDSLATLEAELLPRIPHAVLRVLPATGHLSPLESPRLLAEQIEIFLHGLQ